MSNAAAKRIDALWEQRRETECWKRGRQAPLLADAFFEK